MALLYYLIIILHVGACLFLLDLIRHRRQPDGSRDAAQAH